MRGRGRALSVRSVVALLGLLFVGLSIPSFAAAYPFLETFGSANQPSFAQVPGMAVDRSTENLLVVDSGAGTVSRWNPDGTPSNFGALGTNVIDGAAGGADETPEGALVFGNPGEVQIAIDNSGGPNDGNIYVPQGTAGPSSEGLVDIFDEEGNFIGQLTSFKEGPEAEGAEAEFGEPCGIAVDEAGSIYVGDFSGAIHKYEPAASPPVNGDSSDNFPFASNCTLAAGAGPTDGFLFAVEFGGKVSKLNATTGAEEYEVDAGPTTTVTVDPFSGHLFTAGGEEITEFDVFPATSARELSSTPLGGFAFGVAVNGATGNLYATPESGGTVNVEVFALGISSNRELTIQKTGNGTGTVTSSPAGIDCGSECSAEFEGGAVVELEATPESDSEFAGWTSISGDPGTCTGTTSPCEVTMSEAVELEAEFALKAPTVTDLNPDKGPLGGGNTVTIVGTDLVNVEEIKFGTVAAELASLVEISSTEIEIDAPAQAAGTVDVIVTTEGGTSTNTAADNYTYVVAPTVTEINPVEGPTAGGNEVEITGTNLAEATKVEFEDSVANAPFIENTANTIRLKAPGHSAETVHVVVVTAGGSSPATAEDEYTYIATPAVFSVNPKKGPVAGGNLVEITGSKLANASKVEFGTTEVDENEFIENTDEAIKVAAPAHEVGKVDVRVTTLGGTSLKFSNDQYTYEGSAALTVNAVGTGAGSVTCNGAACSPLYPFGTVLTLVAIAAAGSAFAGWNGGGCLGTGPCVVILEANTSVTATFNSNPPPPPPPPPAGTVEVASNAPVSGGKASLKTTCKNGPCDDYTVTLKAKVNGKNKVIGKETFSLAAGETKTIKVKITNGKVKNRLKEGKAVNAKLSGGHGLNGTTVKLKLSQ